MFSAKSSLQPYIQLHFRVSAASICFICISFVFLPFGPSRLRMIPFLRISCTKIPLAIFKKCINYFCTDLLCFVLALESSSCPGQTQLMYSVTRLYLKNLFSISDCHCLGCQISAVCPPPRVLASHPDTGGYFGSFKTQNHAVSVWRTLTETFWATDFGLLGETFGL